MTKLDYDYDEMTMTLYQSYDYVIYHLGRLSPNNTFCLF